MSRDEYRALTPWSFFLPVSLAVMLGVLVANALGAALFDHDDAPAGPAAAAAVEAGEPADAADGSGPAPAPICPGSMPGSTKCSPTGRCCRWNMTFSASSR